MPLVFIQPSSCAILAAFDKWVGTTCHFRTMLSSREMPGPGNRAAGRAKIVQAKERSDGSRIRVAQPGKAEDAQTAVHVQRFTVAFEYPVYFTERPVRPGQPGPGRGAGQARARRRHRCLVFVDDGLLASRPELGAGDRGLRRAHARGWSWSAPPLPVPGGEADEERAVLRRAAAAAPARAPHRPPLVRARHRRRRGARPGRLRRRDHPSRRPPGPRADHGARAERLRRRREERRQRLRQKNFVGTFAPPFAVAERRALPRDAARRATASPAWPRR